VTLHIGLTGGIGSGKSTVAKLFSEEGISVIDTDTIAHKLCAPNGIAIPFIIKEFGPSFITPEGSMDRNNMRQLIFSDPLEKIKLEKILHPLIFEAAQIEAQNAQGKYLIFAVPLLLESAQWKNYIHRILLVDCALETQIQRTMERSQLSEEEVLAIIHTQSSRQARLESAHDIINNDKSIADLVQQVKKLHAFYCTITEV
jgi:dephospho-CoA kinase